ncbi:hypothetical protein BOX15_Mlig029301g3 [Macrostomum lignano]|uniref:Sodium/potassium-transporting ATPase subunit beta-1-interacting protein n=1 Tax=Macrostomum lignano TaxID=282301 RepID=A0A267E2F4_9PLAT|nr:hypothetical protein BOX15_Mlig029301g3 [Macrostomum lignano]
MAYYCDSPTCASCCLKTVSVTVTMILMAICVERLVLDLLGYQWTGCIFDFATLLSCLFAVAAVCQLRPGFCYAVGAWLLAWLGWNAFLICFYLDVDGLQERAASVLHWGTGKTSYWRKLLIGCSDYRLQLRLPVALLGNQNNGTDSSALWCLVDYRTAELLHCAAGGGAALLSILLLCCLACQLREELRKFERPGGPASAYLPVSANSSFVKIRPGRRMMRRPGDHPEASLSDAAAAAAAASYADNSLGRRSAGSRRSSVMRDPLPWVELQVTGAPPQQQQPPPLRVNSDEGEASEFIDDARPPPYTAGSNYPRHRPPQQQARRRHRSAGSSGRKRKSRRRAAAAPQAAPTGAGAAVSLTAASIPRPSSAIGFHDNLAYARDDELDDPPPPPPPPVQQLPKLPQFNPTAGGGGVVNRTFRLSSESVPGGPATPYASGAAPIFRQQQQPPFAQLGDDEEFPPPPSPALFQPPVSQPPPPPTQQQQQQQPTGTSAQQRLFSPQQQQQHSIHRPLRNQQPAAAAVSSSRSRAPISPDAAFSGLDQLDGGDARLSTRGQQQPPPHLSRSSAEQKPIFVSTRSEAAAAAAVAAAAASASSTAAVGGPAFGHVTSPRASLPRHPSYRSATSPGVGGGGGGGDAGVFIGGVHGSSVLI